MTGTLTISTLSDGTNSTSSTNCIQGSAKAWANFNGTNGSVRASYNVSSVTRNGTGDYTVNFTNAMSDTNYIALTPSNTSTAAPNTGAGGSVFTTTSAKVVCMNNIETGFYDIAYYAVAIFR